MSKIVFKTEWFCVLQNTVKQFNKPYYTIETNDGVVVLAITKHKEVVLVKQYRPALKAYTLELPSGEKDISESAIKTAARELYEETGYKSSRLILLGKDFSIMANRITGKINFFLALEAKKDKSHIPEENVETVLIKQLDFENLIKKGKFQNISGVAIFALAKWHNYL